MVNCNFKSETCCRFYYSDYQEVAYACQILMKKLKSDEHGYIFLQIARSINFPSDILYEGNSKVTSDPPKPIMVTLLSNN